MRLISRLSALMLLACVTVAANAQDGTLRVGSAAPPMKVAKWIKGNPVENLDKGVYVVEFWATWCGPCKTSIPHITELAKKYAGKVAFAGISVWEQKPDDVKNVEDFVTGMGDKMDYSVAVDGGPAIMATTWMKAANQNGIPTAFIVKDGKVQWIGHPMSMEEPLGQVVAGKFDVNEQIKKDQAQGEIEEAMNAAFTAFQKKDFKTALAGVDKVMKSHPEMEGQLAAFRFEVMSQSGDPASAEYGWKIAEKHYWNNQQSLNQIAWNLVDDEIKYTKKPDYKIAVKIAKRANELAKEQDPYILDTYAYALFKTGDVKKAIEIQERAVALLVSGGEIPEETKKEIRERLEMFKKALKK
ncbi:MAG: redoxin family protein [Fimbriimonadaceae bacterium]|nr:redoxin family protein [Fimbriimonadaceae bacterium]